MNPQLIENLDDLHCNLLTIEEYLCATSSERDYDEIVSYIKKGHNFVCYKVDGEYHFAPSRLIGYKDNNLSRHSKYREKHLVTGTDTDRIISKLLGPTDVNEQLEDNYFNFCQTLQIEPERRKRGFWLLNENIDSNAESFNKFSEGEVKLRTHTNRERSRKARLQCIKAKGTSCSVCGMNFEKVYGDLGYGYIQVHHIQPISSFSEKHDVDPINDLVPVCPNCHAMLHRQNNGEFLSISELKDLIAKSKMIK